MADSTCIENYQYVQKNRLNTSAAGNKNRCLISRPSVAELAALRLVSAHINTDMNFRLFASNSKSIDQFFPQ